MIRYFSAAFTVFFLTVAPVSAVTLTIGIDSISGDGQSESLGFYSTSGADGTFGLQTTTINPEPLLSFSFPGGVGAVTAGGGNDYLYDPGSGIMNVTGTLAGLTGDFEFPGGRDFDFDIQLATGLDFTGLPALPAFYETATAVQGSVTAFFSRDPDGPFLEQTITFSSPNEVPLPAGAWFLLSGMALLALRRKVL